MQSASLGRLVRHLTGSPSRTCTYQRPPPSPVEHVDDRERCPRVHSGSIRYGERAVEDVGVELAAGGHHVGHRGLGPSAQRRSFSARRRLPVMRSCPGSIRPSGPCARGRASASVRGVGLEAEVDVAVASPPRRRARRRRSRRTATCQVPSSVDVDVVGERARRSAARRAGQRLHEQARGELRVLRRHLLERCACVLMPSRLLHDRHLHRRLARRTRARRLACRCARPSAWAPRRAAGFAARPRRPRRAVIT